MTTSASKPDESKEYSLIHLLTEAKSDGVVQHFVCYECQGLVEYKTESKQTHDCRPSEGGATNTGGSPALATDGPRSDEAMVPS